MIIGSGVGNETNNIHKGIERHASIESVAAMQKRFAYTVYYSFVIKISRANFFIIARDQPAPGVSNNGELEIILVNSVQFFNRDKRKRKDLWVVNSFREPFFIIHVKFLCQLYFYGSASRFRKEKVNGFIFFN